MRIVGNSYRAVTPWPILLFISALLLIAILVCVFFIAGLFGIEPAGKLGNLGAQGDFFGGHIAAITGSCALLVLLYTGYMQTSYDRTFRIREHFLSGIAVIGQYDVATPGCEQALRLLDYYASVALELDDAELFLLLNTVITKNIRSKLEDLDKGKNESYLDAREAKRRISDILAHYHLNRKGKIGKDGRRIKPNTPILEAK